MLEVYTCYGILQAEDCINRFEYEIAQKFCQRALEIEADNIRALETTGTLLLELGNPESAKQVGCIEIITILINMIKGPQNRKTNILKFALDSAVLEQDSWILRILICKMLQVFCLS